MWKNAVEIQIRWYQWQPPDSPSTISTFLLKLAGIHGILEDRLHMKTLPFLFFVWMKCFKQNEMDMAGRGTDRGLWRADLCHSERSWTWGSIDPTTESFDTFQSVSIRKTIAKILIYLQRNRSMNRDKKLFVSLVSRYLSLITIIPVQNSAESELELYSFYN